MIEKTTKVYEDFVKISGEELALLDEDIKYFDRLYVSHLFNREVIADIKRKIEEIKTKKTRIDKDIRDFRDKIQEIKSKDYDNVVVEKGSGGVV